MHSNCQAIISPIVLFVIFTVPIEDSATLSKATSPIGVQNHSLIAQSSSHSFSITRMGVGGITLGLTGVEVRRILGKPQQIKTEQSACCGTLQRWVYPNITVSLEMQESKNSSDKTSVYHVSTKSQKFATPDGIRVGDHRSKVLKVYGKSHATNEKSAIYYINDQYASNFVFELKGDRVVGISASTQLN